MRRLALITIAATAAVAASHGIALAQRIGVDVYGGPHFGAYYYEDDYRYARPSPRVYGYYRDDRVAPRAAPSGNCGEYHYWNGDYCADARVDPPNIR
jgi:hypothetical protein